MVTNREILTRGDSAYARKKVKKFGVDEVTFDRSARTEYLTGFHKRKVERKEKAVQKAKERERVEKLEERKRVKQERKEQMDKEIKRFNDAMKDITAADVLNGGLSDDESATDFSDWEGIDEEKGILKKRRYSDDSGEVTTVTVEEFSFDEPQIDENVDLTRSEDVLKSSIAKAKLSARVVGMDRPRPKPKPRARTRSKGKGRS